MDSIQTPCIFRASKAGLPRASALGIDQELRLARPEKKTRRPYGALRAVFFLKGGSVPAQRDPQTETQDGRNGVRGPFPLSESTVEPPSA